MELCLKCSLLGVLVAALLYLGISTWMRQKTYLFSAEEVDSITKEALAGKLEVLIIAIHRFKMNQNHSWKVPRRFRDEVISLAPPSGHLTPPPSPGPSSLVYIRFLTRVQLTSSPEPSCNPPVDVG